MTQNDKRSAPGIRPPARTRSLIAWVALATLVAVPVASCTPGSSQAPVTIIKEQPPEPSRSLAGNYLAGRHAQALQDMTAASYFLGSALKLDPDDPNLLRRTFVLLTVEGRLDEAAPLARRVLALKPRDAIANLVVAVEGIKTSRLAPMIKRLDANPKKGINSFMAPLLKAWALVGLKRFDDALAALTPLKNRDGFKALYHLHAALINDTAGRLKQAEQDYLRAAKAQKGVSLRLAELLGNFYERTNRLKEARILYGKYTEGRPDSTLLNPALARLSAGVTPQLEVNTASRGAAEALFDVASSLRQQNANETALVFGRLALWLHPDFPVAQILVGDILESGHGLERANAVFDAINPKSPFYWSARLRIAANLDKMNRTEEAIQTLKAMAKENPSHPDPLIDLGDTYRGHDRFKDAVAAYDQAVARIGNLERRHWSVLYARGISLEQSGQWDRAEADFLKALEFEPNQPYVLNYLGYSWVDKGKNLEKAKAMIRKAVELRPNDGYIVDSFGWVLFRLGDFEGAARELERAVELRAQDPIINDHLGDAYWRIGRKLEARFQWRRALSLDPNKDLIAVIRAKVEQGMAGTADPRTQ